MREFDALLEKLCEQQITDAEREELENLLRQGEPWRERYLNYMDLHATLLLVGNDPASLKPRDQQVAAMAPTPVPTLPIWGFSGSWGTTASLLSLVACAIGIGVWWGSANLKQAAQAPFAAIADNSPPTVSSFKLESGTATLALDKIGSVRVYGPADFELLGPLRARLNRGQIKVRVTEETGYGFEIETPGGKVVDLGTEFSVDVSDQGKTGLVVHEGTVDVHVAGAEDPLSIGEPVKVPQVERLVQGDGVTFDRTNPLSRIMSIVTDNESAFMTTGERTSPKNNTLIAAVSDNLRTTETKRYYEIVPGGLREDALAYVDRPHEWNGVDGKGIPKFLLGADYIKTFNDDKIQDTMKITIKLARPAELYVFWDDRWSKPPRWLTKSFINTGLKMGLDETVFTRPGDQNRTFNVGDRLGVGPGDAIDLKYSIWRRTVLTAGEVTLGSARTIPGQRNVAMYGIAAVELEKNDGKVQEVLKPGVPRKGGL
jgi:ferric-dicitrate binding protein FerR (iron transport regulator)